MELGILIACAIISTISLIMSIVVAVLIIAKEKSTHTVQLMPVDEEIERANKEYLNKWATSDTAIKKEQKLYREEVENEMPEFALTDEDKEIFSL